MQEKMKSVLNDLGNILGYGSAIGLTLGIGWILFLINKHKRVPVPQFLAEPNKVILLTEIGTVGGITTFLGFKLYNTIRKKYSLKY